ncbi:T-cell surface glycoprotein CD5 [Dasypus novemcinctus]|uniref:T-cell surface glycoprotein CD5 n=1 Tax=Dasypus novemcinctus TaxID=9361 RepID=UPI000328BC54|nr:T-cell surface glycoprotein CD5 [Dasypus novemcinctus]XP_004446530.1 T-cell surface glycoprotein CD5 [Dasypus novemcinctus]
MGTQSPPPAAWCLLGMLATSCLGGPSHKDSEVEVKLSGSNSRCQGRLEVRHRGQWSTVCSQSWDMKQEDQQHLRLATTFCRQLGCWDALHFKFNSHFREGQNLIFCHRPLGSFSNCSRSKADQCQPLTLICLEPPTPTPRPTSPPTTTTPEPTAPPRLQLVAEPSGVHCAGVVEFYSGGLGGAVSYAAAGEDEARDLGDLLCGALQCGSFLKHLPQAEAEGPLDPGVRWERRPLPIRWEIQNASCTSLEHCFRKTKLQEDSRALALICSDFQPKVRSRLAGGSSMCEGTVEVRQGKQWGALCSSSLAKGMAPWEEVCQEQQCGHVRSYHMLDTGEKGFLCAQEKLSQCYELREKHGFCKRVFVTCQDHKPAGLGAGTVISIILSLVLLAVLLVQCGPLAYRKLLKKFRQKKQRQWIGPTGMNQNMSFHRNHTVTVRSQVENPTASHVDNEYSQPPRNSHVSAYPALEGALQRSSAQPDNSSDSDYDLHGAQRL